MQAEVDVPAHGAQEAAMLSVAHTARELRRKLRFARFLAFGNVFGLALFAILSLLGGLLESSVPVMALVLGALAWNEERGRQLLRACESAAPRRLATNQLLLLGVIVLYCAWNAYAAWTGPSPLDSVLASHPELPEALEAVTLPGGSGIDELDSWSRTAAVSLYAATAAGSALVQGLSAVYYLSLRPTLEALAALPAWARAAP